MATKAQLTEQDEAQDRIRLVLDDGDQVWTIVRHVSQSGMSRSISTIIINDCGEPWDISPMVAKATGRRYDHKNGGVVVKGCGMDMGSELVYTLSASLFGWENQGAYNLIQRWL